MHILETPSVKALRASVTASGSCSGQQVLGAVGWSSVVEWTGHALVLSRQAKIWPHPYYLCDGEKLCNLAFSPPFLSLKTLL